MHELLQRNLFFVKERVGVLKAVNEYEIYDPSTNELLLRTTEDIGIISKLLRFTDYKRMTPFNVLVSDATGQPVLGVKRGICFLRSRVTVLDPTGAPVGMFLQKLFSLGGAFRLLDMQGSEMGLLRGKWTSWEFSFTTSDGTPLGRVTKQWAGIGRELFTSADNYILEIDANVPPDNPVRQLILGAVLCIDMVLKE